MFIENIISKFLSEICEKKISYLEEFDDEENFGIWLLKIHDAYFSINSPEKTSWVNTIKSIEIYLASYMMVADLIIDFKKINDKDKQELIVAFLQLMAITHVFNKNAFDEACLSFTQEEKDFLKKHLKSLKNNLNDELIFNFKKYLINEMNYATVFAKKFDNLQKTIDNLTKENKKLISKVEHKNSLLQKKDSIIEEHRNTVEELNEVKKLNLLENQHNDDDRNELKENLNLKVLEYNKIEKEYFELNDDYCKLNNKYIELQDTIKIYEEKYLKLEKKYLETVENLDKYYLLKEENESFKKEFKKSSSIQIENTLLNNKYLEIFKENEENVKLIKELKKELEKSKNDLNEVISNNSILLNQMKELRKENLVFKDYNKNLMNRLYLYEQTVMKIDDSKLKTFRTSWVSNELIKDLQSFDYKSEAKKKDEENELLKTQVNDLLDSHKKDQEILNLLDEIEAKNKIITENNQKIKNLEANLGKDNNLKKIEQLEGFLKNNTEEMNQIKRNVKILNDENNLLKEQITLKDSQLFDFTQQINSLQKIIKIEK